MLLYNKAIDLNHTLLRLVSILLEIDAKVVELDKIRIFDFVLANPFYISQMSLGQEFLKDKNKFKDYLNRYQSFEPRMLFESMRPIQDLAILQLVDMGAMQRVDDTTRFYLQPDNVPDELASIALDKENSVSLQAIKFIGDVLFGLELTGPRGLKQASKLMEYRYDVA